VYNLAELADTARFTVVDTVPQGGAICRLPRSRCRVVASYFGS
jgi:hypothetical protein